MCALRCKTSWRPKEFGYSWKNATPFAKQHNGKRKIVSDMLTKKRNGQATLFTERSLIEPVQ
jgi:hypothetical protein